jgi:hypothetical protein
LKRACNNSRTSRPSELKATDNQGVDQTLRSWFCPDSELLDSDRRPRR